MGLSHVKKQRHDRPGTGRVSGPTLRGRTIQGRSDDRKRGDKNLFLILPPKFRKYARGSNGLEDPKIWDRLSSQIFSVYKKLN